MKIRKHQMGGQVAEPMPEEQMAGQATEQSAPAGAEEQLSQLAEQLLQMLLEQIQDPQAVMMVLQMAMEMLQGAAQQGQPAFRRGGKLVR